MAGFPGRWLGVRCFLISLGSTARAARAPRAWRVGQRSETVGGGKAGLAWLLESVAGLLVGDVPLHFPFGGLHQAPRARPLANSHLIPAPTRP